METIKKNSSFRRIYQTTSSLADQNLVIYAKKTGEPTCFGISISSKVGNAVTRNRIKRQIKEILRLNESAIQDGYAIIFVVRVRCRDKNCKIIARSLYHLLRKSDALTIHEESMWVIP